MGSLHYMDSFFAILVYYSHSQLYLIDNFKLEINEFQAICISLLELLLMVSMTLFAVLKLVKIQ